MHGTSHRPAARASRRLPPLKSPQCFPAVCGKNNLIFGTADFQPAAEALEKLHLPLPTAPEQYVIRAGTGLLEPEYDAVVICGADARGMLYGVEAFIRQYADQLPVSFGGDYRSTVFHPFVDPCPPFSADEKPGVARRGLWGRGGTSSMITARFWTTWRGKSSIR